MRKMYRLYYNQMYVHESYSLIELIKVKHGTTSCGGLWVILADETTNWND